MEDPHPLYQYSPIAADQEIRVLQLQPAASFDDTLVTSLNVVKLHDALSHQVTAPISNFDCVSYCWGTKGNTNRLRCDGQSLPITDNVDVMLRHLRKSTKPRYLWIDAICINQGNGSEKKVQIENMGTIYRYANKVHVWLGPSSIDDDIPTVFAALRKLALHFSGYVETAVGDHEATLPPLLESFFTRPWYSRRWILQEVKSAHSMTVHCGKHRISWDWIRDGIGMLLDMNAAYVSDSPDMLISATTAWALEGLGSTSSSKTGLTDIFELLWKYHLNDCSDERDRIFALYALLPPPSAWPIRSIIEPFRGLHNCPIDYSKHFSETYTQLATAAIESGRGTILLEHTIMFGSLMQQSEDWPSWVPAWNMTRMTRHTTETCYPNPIVESDYIGIHKTGNTPRLIFSGQLIPIVDIQVADESVDVFDFFHVAEWPVECTEDELTTSLFNAIEFAGHLQDRDGIDEEAMFSEFGWSALDHFAFHVQPYLREEMNIRPCEEDNPPGTIRKEVRRVLNGLTLVRYCHDDEAEAPGVAFVTVEAKDYLYWLGGVQHTSPYALVVRPVMTQTNECFASNTFRLVGGCMGPLSRSRMRRHEGLSSAQFREEELVTIELV